MPHLHAHQVIIAVDHNTISVTDHDLTEFCHGLELHPDVDDGIDTVSVVLQVTLHCERREASSDTDCEVGDLSTSSLDGSGVPGWAKH